MELKLTIGRTKSTVANLEKKGYFDGSTNVENRYFDNVFAFRTTLEDWSFGGMFDQAQREKYHDFFADPNKGAGIITAIVGRMSDVAAELFQFVELLDKNDKPAASKDAIKAILKPNDLDTTSAMIKQIAQSLLITGDAFIYATKDSKGGILELYVLPSHQVEILSSGLAQPISGFKMSKAARTTIDKMGTGNVMFIRLPHASSDTFYGLSPMATIVKDLEILDTAKKIEKKLLSEGGVKSILTPTDIPPSDNIEAFKKGISDAVNSKSAKTNTVMTVPLQRIAMGDNMVDMAVQSIIEKKERVACNAYSYPVDLYNGNSTFANQRDAKRQSYSICIPYVNLICEGLTQFFGLEKIGLRLKLNTDQIVELQPDNTALVNAMRGICTVDEMREALGYPKLNDKLGGTVFMGLGQVPAEELLNVPSTKEGGEE